MLPPSITKGLENITSMVVIFGVLMLIVVAVAAFLARRFGGRSKFRRQAIFSVVSFVGLCGVAFYSWLRMAGGVHA
jgi:hypothetical protein